MIARMQKSMKEKDQGFTLIELLVVMIIIGILAAIAIPVFLNQRKKAAETAAKADVSTIGKELMAYYVDGAATIFVSSVATTTPRTWGLGTAAAGTDIATGNLSGKNVVGAGSFVTSSTAFCVSVDPTASIAGAATWKFTPAGLLSGTCP